MLTLAAVSAMGTMAIHMLVPALPVLAEELGIGEASAQQLVGIYLVGLGAGQLIAGPLIERYGRRPIMLVGLTLYCVGAVFSTFPNELTFLLTGRLVQALGGAAGLVASRVMVGDLFGPKEAASRQATLMAIVTISPALAPLIGGILTDSVSWRAVPGLLFVISFATLLIARIVLPETRPARDTSANPVGIIAGYARLAKSKMFVFTTVVFMTSATSLYMFLGAAPFLFSHSGMSPTLAGFSLVLIALSIVAGTQMVKRVQRGGDAVLWGAAFAIAGAFLTLILALAGIQSPLAILLPVMLIGTGAGLIGPAAINDIAFAEQGLAATATSLAGALQMLASSASMSLLGLFVPLDAERVAIALVASTVIGLGCALARRFS